MTLDERTTKLYSLMYNLELISSRNEKLALIKTIPEDLIDDFKCCLEVLSGVHAFGYKFINYYSNNVECLPDTLTVRDVVNFLKEPSIQGDLSYTNIKKHCAAVYKWYVFFEPLVNKEWRLGIGPSILGKQVYSPMLAKKYEPEKSYKLNDVAGYYITEKLDGNRCIAYFDDGKWNFKSRNGKDMYVDFDMSNLPTQYVYDGEVLSKEQVELSDAIANDMLFISKASFNKTTGIINTHSKRKTGLIYNIFDIVLPCKYFARRSILDDIKNNVSLSDEVRILPCLTYCGNRDQLLEQADTLLDKVTTYGGEGIMINLASGIYSQKRSDSLLKYKEVFTIDMRVTAVYPGEGKYYGMAGGLHCEAVTDDGKYISCDVGTGLSDVERCEWVNAEKIVGKIVEVAYFSMSQNSAIIGSNKYSLRFPRLKKVREDKSTTSEY